LSLFIIQGREHSLQSENAYLRSAILSGPAQQKSGSARRFRFIDQRIRFCSLLLGILIRLVHPNQRPLLRLTIFKMEQRT